MPLGPGEPGWPVGTGPVGLGVGVGTEGVGRTGEGNGGGTGAGGWFSNSLTAMNNATEEMARTKANEAR